MPIKHGHTSHTSQSATYSSYTNMLARCHRETHPKYPAYGAKGIRVCDQWRESFCNFLADMGERPAGTSIDRIDGSLGYEKSNCRWATPIQQQSNISSNVNIEFNGKTQNVQAWAKELGFAPSNLAWRLRHGWPIEVALTRTPKHGNRTRKTRQRLIEFHGRIQCLSAWAVEFGLSTALLRLRLGKGMPIEEALTKPKGVFVTKKLANIESVKA